MKAKLLKKLRKHGQFLEVVKELETPNLKVPANTETIYSYKVKATGRILKPSPYLRLTIYNAAQFIMGEDYIFVLSRQFMKRQNALRQAILRRMFS